jgi:imidazole glycerol-phosphate synthase subunit HisF
MLRVRTIPCLLLKDGGLVKTIRFAEPRYLGDPINAVRIFNEKCVDELVFLDISATARGEGPDFELLADIASEAFMPLSYGGGVSCLEHVRRLYAIGVEKVIINTALADRPELISEAAEFGGSSGVVASMDVKRNWLGRYGVFVGGGRRDVGRDPVEYARELEQRGAGELLLNSIDRDGTMEGYDLELVRRITGAVGIPVVATGGAGRPEHFKAAVQHGAAAVAAGSMFVFYGKHRAVLITYPGHEELERVFS